MGKRKCLLVFALFSLAISGALPIFAQDKPKQNDMPKAEPKESVPQVYLKDGSIIVGEIRIESIKVTTDYGVLVVPKDQLIGIKVEEQEDEVQAIKFTIKGKVEMDSFEVTTKSGVLKIPKKDMKFIAFSGKFLCGIITNSIGMKFALIPAGEFLMGSPEGQGGSDEQPQHKVKITKPFYLQTTEVTQAQWKAVMGDNPSNSKGDGLPVEQVSWEAAQKFIEKLSAKEGVKYRLPTEAEWEYACRAGSTTGFCFGDAQSELGEYAWYKMNSDGKTHPVGMKKPNAWGLYDIHGNVWEWCQDWYDENYYKNSPADDPQGPGSGSYRVCRGGSWGGDSVFIRSAVRMKFPPYGICHYNGFRVARSRE
jgi:formylglycine-generating enzyme required for sulfatase activity